jgi:hypothetical protein
MFVILVKILMQVGEFMGSNLGPNQGQVFTLVLVAVLNVVVLKVLHVILVLKVDFGVERNQLGNGRVAQQPVGVVT